MRRKLRGCYTEMSGMPAVSFDKPSSSGDSSPDKTGQPERPGLQPFPGAPADRPRPPEPKNVMTPEELRAARAPFTRTSDYQAHLDARAAARETAAPGMPPVDGCGRPVARDGTFLAPERPRPGDQPARRAEATDRRADTAADRNAERVEKLETELAGAKAERSRLVDTVSRQQDRIERKDARIERLETRNDRLEAENDRLKAELAEAREKFAEVSTANAVEARKADAPGDGETYDEPRKRRIGLPSGEAVSIFTAGVGGADAAATLGHVMTSGEGTLAGAGATLIVAGYVWGKKKWESRHSDRPED